MGDLIFSTRVVRIASARAVYLTTLLSKRFDLWAKAYCYWQVVQRLSTTISECRVKSTIYISIILNLFCCQVFASADWIESQVLDDLSYISKRIKKSDLYAFMDEYDARNGTAVLLEFRNGQMTFNVTKRAHGCPRRAAVVSYFRRLNALQQIPNTAFVVLLGDRNPQYQNDDVPAFAFSKREGESKILMPDFEILCSGQRFMKFLLDLSSQFTWKQKEDIAFFRGASTGNYSPKAPFFNNTRARLVFFSYYNPEFVNARFSVVYQKELGAKLRAFGIPINKASIPEHYTYKYLMDVDGNTSTFARCRWILASNSVLLKVKSENRQWYYKALKTGENYIEIEEDLANLIEVISYLRENDAEAYAIAMKGQTLAKKIFSPAMRDKFILTLIHRYAKLVDL